jgi:hypothetical protein
MLIDFQYLHPVFSLAVVIFHTSQKIKFRSPACEEQLRLHENEEKRVRHIN